MLVDGQGNFGSVDGDNPAAMRYTEAKLRRISEDMLADLDKNTVDFRPNFDDSLTEPTVLPAKIPNLLVNGASGIAVGMATNMPPHNLREVVDGIQAYIDNNDIEIDELMQFVKGPDFPTGGLIYGVEGIRQAYHTGKGRVVMRALAEIKVNKKDRERIVITEIPYQVNKATTIEKISMLVNEKRLEGISDVNDLSDRDGMRIVVDVKREANAQIVLNQLYQMTPLQSSFSINNVALVNGRPMVLNLKDMIRHFVEHRHEVVVRRTQYELEEARKRAHILEGLLIALDHLDEVIALIRASQTPDLAREGLMERFSLSEIQAKAILDMRLQRLTGLERDKIQAQYREIMERIQYYESILDDFELRMQVVKDELQEVRDRFGDDRKTQIVPSEGEITLEDLIANERMVITISDEGYIKRTPEIEYRVQGRGGTGLKGVTTKEADTVENLFVAQAHNYLLFFTEQGRCFWLKVYQIPKGSRASRGRAIQNLIAIDKDDKVKAFITVENLEEEEFLNSHFIIMATKKGIVKKTSLKDYSRPRINGINAITINEGDELLEAKLTDGSSDVILGVRSGRAVRFKEDQVRSMGRTAAGVIGIRLSKAPDDEVVGMVVASDENVNLLVVSEKGFGKQTSLREYPVINRGGKGVLTLNITGKTGKLIAIKQVAEDSDLMIITKNGITIRMSVDGVSEFSRNTQGVRLIRLKGDDKIASVAVVPKQEEEDETEEGVEQPENLSPENGSPENGNPETDLNQD
jgi:DNA gyrase subunit A